jgi:nucleoside-diphosphate-sugar epimerase
LSQQVLVTGGAGFIGSHLSEELIRRNYRVRVLDNFSSGLREWVPAEAELLEGDIRDPQVCREACRDCRGVFHLAAMSRSAASLDAIEYCTANNIAGTQNLLLAAQEAGAARFVYSGPSTYYGLQDGPHRESMPPDLMNWYGLSKYVGEQYCLMFDRLRDLPCVVLRYFNVYGPRQPEDGVYALVLGIFLRRRELGLPLVIHGDGAQRRDFVHVHDVVRANILAFESGIRREVLNIGSGGNVSIKQLADMISPDQIAGPPRIADAKETLADISRAESLLGWRPEIGIREGVARMIADLQEAACH